MKKEINIAIIGYGQMGKMVQKLILDHQQNISVIIDNEEEWKEKYDNFLKSDVAIEFSTPETAILNLTQCFDAHIPVVCGTTGWHDKLNEVIKIAKEKNGSLIYGSNFSVGANLFFLLNEYAAELLDSQSQYDVAIEETHHIRKKDAPSGTAITTAETIISKLSRKKGWCLGEQRTSEQIVIEAYREGDVIGTHRVIYSSAEDDIEILHRAHNRLGFAKGAFLAAQWLAEHQGIYEFKDIFPQFLK